MRAASTPSLGMRYWVAICAASIAGCNLGDFVSLYLHWGHWIGLVPLALLLAALLWAESRARVSEVWYWAAVLVIRTAATNVADLATHTFGLKYSWVIAALAALQVLMVRAVGLAARDASPRRYPKPVADGWYWMAMLAAGTLGTAVGDCIAEVFKFGTGWGTVGLSAILAAVLACGFAVRWSTKGVYWLAIIAVRSAGTTAGDWLAFSEEGGGLGLGLLASTALSCGTFVGVLCGWRPPPRVDDGRPGAAA